VGKQELGPIIIQKKIKSGFKVTKIWSLNPKAMDHKIRPFKVYTTTLTNISDEDIDGFDNTIDGQE
jgi:hypothetical protein